MFNAFASNKWTKKSFFILLRRKCHPVQHSGRNCTISRNRKPTNFKNSTCFLWKHSKGEHGHWNGKIYFRPRWLAAAANVRCKVWVHRTQRITKALETRNSSSKDVFVMRELPEWFCLVGTRPTPRCWRNVCPSPTPSSRMFLLRHSRRTESKTGKPENLLGYCPLVARRKLMSLHLVMLLKRALNYASAVNRRWFAAFPHPITANSPHPANDSATIRFLQSIVDSLSALYRSYSAIESNGSLWMQFDAIDARHSLTCSFIISLCNIITSLLYDDIFIISASKFILSRAMSSKFCCSSCMNWFRCNKAQT